MVNRKGRREWSRLEAGLLLHNSVPVSFVTVFEEITTLLTSTKPLAPSSVKEEQWRSHRQAMHAKAVLITRTPAQKPSSGT